MTEPLIEKLATRGFWRVEIRPQYYLERRVESTALLARSVEKAAVQLRGWDFPHLSHEQHIPESQTSISESIDWSVHVEIWRAFLSGQFIYRGGVWTDWFDQHHFRDLVDNWEPKTALPIASSLWSLTEYFEFAARYSQTDAGDDKMHVEVTFDGLGGRILRGDHERRAWFGVYGPAKAPRFQFERDLTRAELVSSARQLAVKAAGELFQLFGWQAQVGLLDEIQAELFQGRSSG